MGLNFMVKNSNPISGKHFKIVRKLRKKMQKFIK
mgnify:CR=1 FL=1